MLQLAEQSALAFDNGELLSQICFQQSRVAEEQGDYELAFQAFQKYRRHALKMLKEQTHRVSMDKARGSKRQLEQRARKLINRIRAQHEYDPEKQFSNVVSETYWWEQLVLFKTELKHSNHAVIMIRHSDPAFLDICTELVHSLTTSSDLISLKQRPLGDVDCRKGPSRRALPHRLRYVRHLSMETPWFNGP